MAKYTTQNSKPSQTKTVDVHTREHIDAVIVDVGKKCHRLAMLDGPIINDDHIVSNITDVLRAMGTHDNIERVFIDMFREPIIKVDETVGIDQQSITRLFTALITTIFQLRANGIRNEDIVAEMNSIAAVVNDDRLRRHRCFRKDIDALIDSIARDDRVANIAKRALVLAGAGGHITFKTEDVKKTVLTLSSGYIFNTVVPQVTSSFEGNMWTGTDVKIAIVDGFIDSVASIDHILSRAHDEYVPVVMFARQFAPEVITTAAVNARRNTLIFIPVVVPYDIESANILKDIAVVVGGDVVSALKGQLVTSIDFDELPTIEHIVVSTKDVEIKTTANRSKICKYVEHLRRELNDPERHLSRELIARRMQNLLGRCVVIRMPRSDVEIHDVERVIRYVANTIKFGFIDTEKLVHTLTSGPGPHSNLPALTSIYIDWIKSMPRIASVTGLMMTLQQCHTNIELIMSAGAVIVNR